MILALHGSTLDTYTEELRKPQDLILMQETHTQAATCRGVQRRQPLLNMTSTAAQDSPVATH